MRYDPRRSWYAWRHYNPASATEPIEAFVGGYERGWRDAFADQTRMAEALRVLQESEAFIRALQDEREAILMMLDSGEISAR